MKKYESGRSMVEMLGTLAIMGILSIGGIAGYNYGINKYRANTIINDIMLRATDAIAQFDATGDANLSEWPTITAGKYTIGLEEETIGIQVDGLPKELCEMVYEGMKNHADIKFNATIYGQENDTLECGDTNTMVFYVEDTINIGRGEQLPDQTECSTNKECQTEDVCMGCIIPEGQETGVCEYACQELEYLESDGGQYIDTQITYQESKAVINLCYTKSATRELMGFGPYGSAYIDKTSDGLLGLGNNSNISTSNAYKWQEIVYKTNGGTPTGISELTSPDGSATRTSSMGGTPGTFYLFAVYGSTAYNCHLKIATAKFYDANTGVIADFIPVLDPEGVPAMLDKVENKLYYNQGSGQFTYSK